MGGLAQAAVFRLMPNRAKRITLLLFPSRVLTRSGSADPELTVSAWRNFVRKLCARHSDKKPQYRRPF
ncbi:MAG: hypothetical protein ACFWUG_15450 [Rahnella inusitata]